MNSTRPVFPCCRRLAWTWSVSGLALALSLGGFRLDTVASPVPAATSEPRVDQTRLLSAPVRVGRREAPRAEGVGAPAETWRLPLAFEPADSRSPADIDFLARGAGYAVMLGAEGALIGLRSPATGPGSQTARHSRHEARSGGAGSVPRSAHWIRMRFDGGRDDARAAAQAPLPGRVHRLVGADPRRWRTAMQPHARVVYQEVYPGIDVAYYGTGGELEYDLVLEPGARLEQARVRFDGVRDVRLDAAGNLQLDTGTRAGVITQRRPVAYQVGPEGREPVAAGYVLLEDGRVGFEVGEYDRDRVLVVDPVVSYATFLGGTEVDRCWDIAVDAAGAAFIVGETQSPEFPGLRVLSTNVAFATFQGGMEDVAGDAFVAKLNADGSAMEWFTYLGGSDLDAAFTLALAPGGEPVVGGFTTSLNFPLTTNALQTVVRGQTNRFTGRRPLEAFVTRLTADGSGILASTLFGGDGEEQVLDLQVHDDGRVVAVGTTTSTNLPVTQTGLQSGLGGGMDAFLAVFSADATTLLSATYLGGDGRDSAEGVTLDGTGMAHVVGITASTNLPVLVPWQSTNAGAFDALAAGFRLADAAAVYVTYLGGSFDDYGYRNTLDPSGDIWLVGETASTNFPVVAALQGTNAGLTDGFVARWSARGRGFVTATYFGGTQTDALWSARADADGNLHVVGGTYSSSLPGLTTNALQAANAGSSDLLLARLAADGTVSSTFYGSDSLDVAYGLDLDPAGNSYVVGRTLSVDFPVSGTNVAQVARGDRTGDGFVVKLTQEPRLEAALAADGVEVSWPAPNPGFVLETASALDATESWGVVTEPVEVVARRHVVRLPLTATNCLFRLRWTR